MTTYHRGKKRSVYRKRSKSLALAHNQVGAFPWNTFQTPPTTGTTLIKSIRGRVLIPALGSSKYAAGWVGFARVNNLNGNPVFDIEQSEVFGVQPWVIGPNTDNELILDLKGITLTVDETFLLVGRVNFATANTTVQLLAQFIYAEHEMPA